MVKRCKKHAKSLMFRMGAVVPWSPFA